MAISQRSKRSGGVALAACIGLRLYRLTGNIYLGGIVNALLVAMLTVANTSFTYPY